MIFSIAIYRQLWYNIDIEKEKYKMKDYLIILGLLLLIFAWVFGTLWLLFIGLL